MGKFTALTEIHSHMELWHKGLGHMSQKGLGKLCNWDKFDTKGSKLDFCYEYQYGKQVKNSYFSTVSRKPNWLDLVHFDVCNMSTNSMRGSLYFISFVGDHSRKLWVYLYDLRMKPLLHLRNFMQCDQPNR